MHALLLILVAALVVVPIGFVIWFVVAQMTEGAHDHDH